MHAEKTAEALVKDLRARLSDLDRRLAGAAPRRVLFVVWTDPLISIGRDTFIADALRHAGAQSVVDTAAEWPRINLEEIVRLQPEFLVFASAHAGDTQHDIDALRSRPGWRDLDALRHGKIVVISDAINRPAPRMVDAIEQLARALHPESFASRDAASAESQAQSHGGGLRVRPLTVRRLLWTCGSLAAVLLACVVLALKLGAVPISVTDLVWNLGRVALGRSDQLPDRIPPHCF